MKNKKIIRKFTVLLAALVIMCGFSVTAYAGGGDESDDTPTPVTEETPAPETEPEETTGGYEPVSYTHLDVYKRQVMDGGKCILQLRGVRPFLSDKYDITKHPNYKYLSDFDKKNAFDVERYMSTLSLIHISCRPLLLRRHEQHPQQYA